MTGARSGVGSLLALAMMFLSGTGVAAAAWPAFSTTSLTAVSNGPLTSSNPPVTNQGVTLFSTVTSVAGALLPPSGTVEFENGGNPIDGCGAVPLSARSSPPDTVSCATSFAAPASPAQLTAVFNPAQWSFGSGSVSQPESFPILKDSTSTTVTTPDSTPNVDARVTYTALVTPSQAGPLTPSGAVTFADGERPIRSCRSQPLASPSIATCTVRYTTTGHHRITASYGGDGSFNGSRSGVTSMGVQAGGAITATTQWSFYFTPSYTHVLQLIVSGVPSGASIVTKCHGGGCPFTRRTTVNRETKRCGRKGRHRCGIHSTIDLTPAFSHSQLGVGTRITVEITKRGWVGKDYVFAVRSSRSPQIRIGCSAPGRASISAAC